MMPIELLVPGSLETRTGGYVYDRRMVDELGRLGCTVSVHELDDSFPNPSRSALADADRVLTGLRDEAIVMVDGLAYGAMPDEAARHAARLRLVALVHHPLAHETGLPLDAATRLEASERRALAHARRVIVTSRRTAAVLAAFDVALDRISVVEPGTDRAPVAQGSGSTVPHMVCVATLTARKGHHTLFSALARLRDVPWRLTCVGSLDRDSALVARLRTMLRDEGMEDRVLLAGEADAAGVAEHYNRADLFVLATEYEGYGMAVAEALARGLPVISTPTGAIEDIVISGAGVLVPHGDEAALADALRRVLTEPGLRAQMASAAVLVRDRLPSWSVAALRMASALEHVARPPQGQNPSHERVQR